MSSWISNALYYATTKLSTIALKLSEWIFNKSCSVCCQCMQRFPGLVWIIVRALILLFFVALSISLALCSYIFLYWLMIPSLHYEWPVHFDYTQSLPSSIVNINQLYEWYLFDLPFEFSKQQQTSLKPHELYDVSIHLHIPQEQEYSNVMMKLSLYACGDGQGNNGDVDLDNDRHADVEYMTNDKFQIKYGWRLLRKASRSILLQYESTLVRIVKKIIFIVPYCLGIWSEDIHLTVPIMQNYGERVETPTCAAVIQLSTAQFHVYDASIHFDVQLQGLQYLLYHWWITSSLVVLVFFSFVCCATTSPMMMLCCYQVNKLRDCYNQQTSLELDEDEEVEEEEEEDDEVEMDMDMDMQLDAVGNAELTSEEMESIHPSSSSLLATNAIANPNDGLRRRNIPHDSQIESEMSD